MYYIFTEFYLPPPLSSNCEVTIKQGQNTTPPLFWFEGILNARSYAYIQKEPVQLHLSIQFIQSHPIWWESHLLTKKAPRRWICLAFRSTGWMLQDMCIKRIKSRITYINTYIYDLICTLLYKAVLHDKSQRQIYMIRSMSKLIAVQTSHVDMHTTAKEQLFCNNSFQLMMIYKFYGKSKFY